MMDNITESLHAAKVGLSPLDRRFQGISSTFSYTELEYPPIQPFFISRYLSGDIPIDFLKIREK